MCVVIPMLSNIYCYCSRGSGNWQLEMNETIWLHAVECRERPREHEERREEEDNKISTERGSEKTTEASWANSEINRSRALRDDVGEITINWFLFFEKRLSEFE